MWSVISSLLGWESDLWLGLECLFNEQLLCPCRVSFTNEWVTVTLALFLAACVCLLFLKSTTGSGTQRQDLSLGQGRGSSQDHRRWLAAASLRCYSQWMCLDFRAVSSAVMSNYIKKGQIKYELLCHNQQKFGVLETFRVSAVLYMWKFSHSWTMSDSYSSRKVSVCCRVIRNNSLKSKSEVMYLRAGSPTQFQWKRMNSVKLSD